MNMFHKGNDDEPPYFDVDWVEVQYGDDEMQTRVTRDSDEFKRDWYAKQNYDELNTNRSL